MAHRFPRKEIFGKKFRDRIYSRAYSRQYDWENIIKAPKLLEYLDLKSKEICTPITASMAQIIPMVSALVGPKTKIDTSSGEMVLNTYIMFIVKPGGGKSPAFNHCQREPAMAVHENFNCNILVENFSLAGLRRHHNDNDNRCLLTNDEGGNILKMLIEGKTDEDRVFLLNKLWNGYGDKNELKKESPGFEATSFSMTINVQPAILFNRYPEICSNEGEGLNDRINFMVERATTTKIRVSICVRSNYNYYSFTLLICTYR